MEIGAGGVAIENNAKVTSIQETQRKESCLNCVAQQMSHLVSTAHNVGENTLIRLAQGSINIHGQNGVNIR